MTSTLEPYASLITAEFREKVGYPVSLDFKKLAAADVAARARAYGTLVASGVDKEDASEVSRANLVTPDDWLLAGIGRQFIHYLFSVIA